MTRLLTAARTEQRWVPTEAVDGLLATRPQAGLFERIRAAGCEVSLTADELEAVKFVDTDLARLVADTNEQIATAELITRRSFFDAIEKSPLTDEQARAVVCSDQTARRLQDSFPGVPVETVSLGVDYARIDSVSPAANGADVVFAGRLLENKNVDLLLDAIALLSRERAPLRCLIIGEGPERRRLEEQAARLGIQGIEFSDFVPEHDGLIATLKASRALVLPSEREGFGLVIVEANACGLPVVTLDHPNNAARYLVNPGMNGYLCSKNAASLAGAIVRALDQGLSSDWHRPEHYDWSVVADQVDRLLQSVVALRDRFTGRPRNP